MIALGLVGGFIPTATFTLAPETMPDPRFAGLALGIVSVGQNLGMFFGPPIVGSAIAGGNWAAGITPLVAALAVGVAAAVWLSIRQTKSQAVKIEAPSSVISIAFASHRGLFLTQPKKPLFLRRLSQIGYNLRHQLSDSEVTYNRQAT